MDCEYFISGQARKVNVSVVSWENETRTGDRRETKIGVLDNRPLNTLVSWKEDENGKFDQVHFFHFLEFPPDRPEFRVRDSAKLKYILMKY